MTTPEDHRPPRPATSDELDRAERCALAFAIDAGAADLPTNISRLIECAPESFSDPRYAKIAVCIRAMREQGQAVHFESVGVKCGELSFVGELLNSVLRSDLAEREAESAVAAFEIRKARSIFDEASAAMNCAPSQAKTICAGAIHALTELSGADSEVNMQRALDRLQSRLFNIRTKPAEPVARYSIGAIPICTPGNLTTVSAVPKAGKTAWIGAMMGAAMTPRPEGVDCLGLLSRNPAGHALIHLDSEQSLFDAFMVISTALRRAGLSEPPPWLKSYCITGFTIPEARQCIHLAMEQASKEHGGIHGVLLDGSADFVQDVNDPGESNLFVNELHGLAIKFHCPITSVIHLNPGTEKTRGHLGSQLERKSETNLRLERDGDSIVVWADKNRRAPISKAQGPRFQWSDELKMHVSIESAGDAKAQAKRQEQQEHAEDVFDAAKQSSLSWSALVENYGQTVLKSSRKERTARRHVDEMIRAGIFRKNLIGHYELA